MSSFDPNTEPETQDQMDAYVNWCATNFMRLSQGTSRTYRTGVRCAHWLLVVSCAQLHLDDDQEDDREALLHQIAMYSRLARSIERQRDRYPVERLIQLRASLDCWEPVGLYGANLLTAARMAVSALTLIDLHPLVDLWDLGGEDVWSLIEEGANALAIINDGADNLTFDDYAIRRDESVVAKFTWQRVNSIHRHMGAGPVSPN
jgi:hypothetical protein